MRSLRIPLEHSDGEGAVDQGQGGRMQESLLKETGPPPPTAELIPHQGELPLRSSQLLALTAKPFYLPEVTSSKWLPNQKIQCTRKTNECNKEKNRNKSNQIILPLEWERRKNKMISFFFLNTYKELTCYSTLWVREWLRIGTSGHLEIMQYISRSVINLLKTCVTTSLDIMLF